MQVEVKLKIIIKQLWENSNSTLIKQLLTLSKNLKSKKNDKTLNQGFLNWGKFTPG